jgi:hypothetical protein
MEKNTTKKETEFNFRTITSFEAACAATGDNPEEVTKGCKSPQSEANERVKVIVKAINGPKFKADLKNADQEKCFPVFSCRSGFRFLLSISYDGGTHANLGSCFLYEDDEKCEFGATQFLSEYEKLIEP